MTVKELIETLEAYNPDLPVVAFFGGQIKNLYASIISEVPGFINTSLYGAKYKEDDRAMLCIDLD